MSRGDVRIVVLFGGVGPEREVSLRSGATVREALQTALPGEKEKPVVRAIELTEPSLPAGLDPGREVIVPILHGEYGEDGTLQAELEAAGFAYAGSDSRASRLCMDKVATRDTVAAAGVRVPPACAGGEAAALGVEDLYARLGEDWVAKPRRGGSSVAVHLWRGRSAVEAGRAALGEGDWLFERFVPGRELSVGMLGEEVLGIVEVLPDQEIFDYEHKYTEGASRYRVPADLPPPLAAEVGRLAREAFAACGCRDFGRVDFRLEGQQPWFLEINTLPGMTAQSLFPRSAAAQGFALPALVRAMAAPALARFRQSHR
jgi:D-alanine-D-alanine ligase